MIIKALHNDPYGEAITSFLFHSFPRAIEPAKSRELLDVLTSVIIGDKNTRYGPIPSVEKQVVIRKVISDAIAINAPIPILVPWGGRKLNKALKLDMAEVSGIRQLISTDELVKRFYKPGLQINVRIEDVNAEWLYKDSEEIREYSDGMVKLINMLKGDTNINGMLESEMMNPSYYFDLSALYAKLLTDVLVEQESVEGIDVTTLTSFQELSKRGWKGIIPKEQRTYYLDRYKVLYPGKMPIDHIIMLAEYFAGSKTRYDLGGRGNPDSKVDGFIQINFASPVPCAPSAIFSNTLYYRTVPMNQGKTHISPWRGKGYLKIENDNTVKVKVTNYGNDVIKEFITSNVQIEDIIISTDYMLESVQIPYFI